MDPRDPVLAGNVVAGLGDGEQVQTETEGVVDTLRLEVHPSVVFKLGSDLITDDMQALIELIKNSYDADASRVRVSIDTRVITDAATGEVVENVSEEALSGRDILRGAITIIDDGTGMDFYAIKRGWLTVSMSRKQSMKARGETTAKKRTPLGDKGLGRLGAQRLGEVLTLTTRQRPQDANRHAADPDALRVSIRWSRFAEAESLNAVPIEVHSLSSDPNVPVGTKLEIHGLRDPEFWRQNETNDLQQELAAMISPYEGVSGFQMSLRIDGTAINLREKAQAILDAAPSSYAFSFDGQELNVTGRFEASFLRPQGREEVAVYEEIVEGDNGYGFAEWLFDERSKHARGLGIEQGDDKHFIISNASFRLDELKNVELNGEKPVDPGPFHGEVSSLPLTRSTTSVFDRNSDYREFVKALLGIKVYRDGFGVRVDDDWLNLGAKWTSGSSYYNLRPGNVTGYVSISARDNAALEETTNREAFRDTPAYRNFYRLLTVWADYTGRVQEYLRRGYNDYRRSLLAEVGNVSPRATPEQLLRQASNHIEQSNKLVSRTSEARGSIRRIKEATADLATQKRATESTVFQDPLLTRALESSIEKVNKAAQEADALIGNLDELLREQTQLRAGISLLEQQFKLAQEQIGDAWESVALGLSAETLAHEVQHISEGLRARSAQITNYLRGINSKDQRLWTFIEHVRSSSGALSKQVSRLTPSLRYMREQRSSVLMSNFIERLESFYSDRWGKNGLQIAVSVEQDFIIRVNEGKLTQVFDNLILNSEYWLFQQIAARKLDEGVISIHIDKPFILLEDNGPGIDPHIEELVFEPFMTTKPAQQGRGLGLFVVKQLLDSLDSSITLVSGRNRHGRRYQFRLNFSAVVASGEGDIN